MTDALREGTPREADSSSAIATAQSAQSTDASATGQAGTPPAAEANKPINGPQHEGAEHPGADAPRSQHGPRIKIGTQRPGAVAPKAKPLPLPAVAVKAKELKERAEPAPPSARRGSPDRAAEEAADHQGPPPAPDQQGSDAPRSPEPPPRPRERVPMPNLRERSEDVEQELQVALGDVSLDEVVTAQTPESIGAPLESRSQHRARIVSIHNDDVFVELGPGQQGVLSLRQFAEPPPVGAEIEVMVGGYNADEGLYTCVPPGGAIAVEDWSQLVEGAVVEATITGHNKGGLEVQIHNIRGFIPAGQISLYRVEDFSQFVGQKLNCVVTEANERRKNLVLSRRAVLEREKAEAKEKLMAELAPGQVREGIVRKVMDFGAFVDLGGVDGLLHVSRMSWQRVRHPSEIVKEGDRVRVQVEKIDPDTRKISLSMREFMANPWESVEGKYPPKTVIRGVVTKTMDFGAFVQLEPGIEGLVHISEMAHHRVFRVTDIVKEGQEVEAEVQSVDRENKRISLSIKALTAKAPPPQQADQAAAQQEAAPPQEPPRSKPQSPKKLKGGLGRSPNQFGLKW
jgi:small subunit ribosomal protein S1